MAKQHIEFEIGSTFSGEGFRQLQASVKASRQQLNVISSGVKGIGVGLSAMGGLAGEVGGAFGKVGGAIGGAVASFAMGGPWGFALNMLTQGIGLVGKWIGKFNELKDGAELAARGMSKEFMSASHQMAGHLKLVAKWREKMNERNKAADAEKRAAAEQKKADEEEHKRILNMKKEANAILDIQREISREKMKDGLYSDDKKEQMDARAALMKQGAQDRVDSARNKLESATLDAGGNTNDMRVLRARAELELEEERLATTLLEIDKMYAGEKAASEAVVNAAMQKAWADQQAAKKKKEQQAKEDALAKRQEAHAAAMIEIDKKIAAAKERAAALEENAKLTRGKSFDDWQRDERERARAQRGDKNARRMAASDRELQRLEARFALSPRSMSKKDLEKLAKLREWKQNQDPNNNPALKEAKRLEAKREQLQKDHLKAVKDIRDTLKNATI